MKQISKISTIKLTHVTHIWFRAKKFGKHQQRWHAEFFKKLLNLRQERRVLHRLIFHILIIPASGIIQSTDSRWEGVSWGQPSNYGRVSEGYVEQ